MALGKCGFISHGPGDSELLKGGEAILVPSEDPDALAQAIQDPSRLGAARVLDQDRPQGSAICLFSGRWGPLAQRYPALGPSVLQDGVPDMSIFVSNLATRRIAFP